MSARTLAALLAVVAGAGLLAGCGSGDADGPRTGAAIYRQTCATCHGREGRGFVGPSLVDAAARYPDVADEIALVTSGRNQMPAFGATLSAEEIRKVVEYTRGEFSSTTTTAGPVVGPTMPSTGG